MLFTVLLKGQLFSIILFLGWRHYTLASYADDNKPYSASKTKLLVKKSSKMRFQ